MIECACAMLRAVRLARRITIRACMSQVPVSYLHMAMAAVVFHMAPAPAMPASGGDDIPHAYAGEAGAYAAAQRCGQNSVYMLMRANGHTAAYEAVLREVAGTSGCAEHGTSLAQLVGGATRLGFPCAAKRLASFDELHRARLPVIVHCAGGHYCLLVRLEGERVTLIDGSSGRQQSMTADDFVRRWTRYVVEPLRPASGMGEAIGYVLAAGGLALCAFSVFATVREPRAWRRIVSRMPRCTAILRSYVVVSVFCATPKSGAAQPPVAVGDTVQRWRVAEHDGLNCLYLLLRLADSRVEYGDLLALSANATTRRLSLDHLQRAARELGMETAVTKRRPTYHTPAHLPLIAHIDGARPDGGEFVLVVGRSRSKLRIVRGGTMTLADVSMDEFLRDWSGFVLERAAGSLVRVAFAAAGAGFWLIGLYLSVRRARARPLAGPIATRDERSARPHLRTEVQSSATNDS